MAVANKIAKTPIPTKDALLVYWRQGWNLEMISKEYHVNRSTVSRWFVKYGMPVRQTFLRPTCETAVQHNNVATQPPTKQQKRQQKQVDQFINPSSASDPPDPPSDPPVCPPPFTPIAVGKITDDFVEQYLIRLTQKSIPTSQEVQLVNAMISFLDKKKALEPRSHDILNLSPEDVRSLLDLETPGIPLPPTPLQDADL